MIEAELIEMLRNELLRCADALDGAALVLGHDKQIITAATCRERAYKARARAGWGMIEGGTEAGASGQETGLGVGVRTAPAGEPDPLAVAPFDPANVNGYNPLQAAYAAAIAKRRKAQEMAFIAAGRK